MKEGIFKTTEFDIRGALSFLNAVHFLTDPVQRLINTKNKDLINGLQGKIIMSLKL